MGLKSGLIGDFKMIKMVKKKWRSILIYLIDKITEKWGEIPQLKLSAEIILVYVGFSIILLFIVLVPYRYKGSYENIILLSLVFGSAIAFFGLQVALRRIRIVASQLLDEQLKPGADLLADKEVGMRQKGINILEDIAKTTTAEGKKRIIRIIYDFIITNSQLNYAKDKGVKQVLQKAIPAEERLDIELAVKTVINLVEFSEATVTEIPFSKIDLRLLNFAKLKTNLRMNFQESALSEVEFMFSELSGVNFKYTELNGTSFQYAGLSGAIFENAELNEVNFWNAKLNEVDFLWAKLSKVDFSHAELSKVDFSDAELDEVFFSRAKLDQVNFASVKLNGANFEGAELKRVYFWWTELRGVCFKDAKLLTGVIFWNADCSESDFEDAIELTQEQINEIIFEKDKEPKLPEGLEIPKNRAYIWQKDEEGEMKPRFVKSDAEWSEKWVDEWPEVTEDEEFNQWLDKLDEEWPEEWANKKWFD